MSFEILISNFRWITQNYTLSSFQRTKSERNDLSKPSKTVSKVVIQELLVYNPIPEVLIRLFF